MKQLLVFFILIFSSSVHSQNQYGNIFPVDCSYDDAILLKYENGLFYFFDLITNEPITPKYSEKPCGYGIVDGGNCFINGDDYFIVKINNKWGAMNMYGKFEIKPEYDEITKNYQYSKKEFYVVRKKSDRFIISNGKTIPFEAEKVADSFWKNHAVLIYPDKVKFISNEGKIKDSLDFEITGMNANEHLKLISVVCNKGVISKSGKIIVAFAEQEINMSKHFIGIKRNGKYALANLNGKILTDFKYDFIDDYGGDDEPVYIYTINKKEGLLSIKGKELCSAKYDDIINSKGYNIAIINEKYGFIDDEGKLVIPMMYDGTSYFNNDRARVLLNGKVGYINLKGEIIIPCIYDDVWGGSFHNGTAEVKKDGNTYYINTKGKCVKDCP